MVERDVSESYLIRMALQRMKAAWIRLDLGVGLAFGWLLFALIVTVWWGPRLGLRGMAWMAIHHILCLIGCVHELRRGWRRYQKRKGKRDAS